jgi:hypothetical protein
MNLLAGFSTNNPVPWKAVSTKAGGGNAFGSEGIHLISHQDDGRRETSGKNSTGCPASPTTVLTFHFETITPSACPHPSNT